MEYANSSPLFVFSQIACTMNVVVVVCGDKNYGSRNVFFMLKTNTPKASAKQSRAIQVLSQLPRCNNIIGNRLPISMFNIPRL
jgi:hypothetical protein